MKKFASALLLLLLTALLCVPVRAAGKARMSVSSVTLVKGETYTLKALVGETARKASSWKSENPDVASVSSSGKVKAKARGSSVIRAEVSGKTVECLVSVVGKTDTESVRYSVLIMDTSRSMKGSALTYAKSAAKKFVKTLLAADGRNYVAVVTLNSKPKTICTFTNKRSALNKKIGGVKASGYTNMQSALAKAGKLLENVPGGSGVTKNIVLLSDGLPQSGKKKVSGRYSRSDHRYYKYANSAYATDKKLKRKYFVYALGFFHKSSGKDLKFGRKLMKDLASKDKYYVITDKKEIKKTMNEIADTITSVTLNRESAVIYVGDTLKLQLFANGEKKSGSWRTSDSSIASVSSSGLVTGKAPGTVRITGIYKGKKAVCKVTVKRKKGHRYKVYHDAMTRKEASAKCRARGGYLACINSASEQKTIEALVKKNAKKNNYWLGGVKKDGTWKWDDGTAFSYTNWDTGNSEGSGSEDMMAFVAIPRPGTTKEYGEWVDTLNEGEGNEFEGYYSKNTFGYICEWDS